MKRVRYTAEEKEEDKKDIEKMLRQGIRCSVIADELGRTTSYVGRVKKELIDIGKITQEEIDKALKMKIEEKEMELQKQVLEMLKEGKNKAEIQKITKAQYRDINLAIEKIEEKDGSSIANIKTVAEIEKNEKKKKILEALKAGQYPGKISKELPIPRTTMNRYIDELIAENKIKKEEIKNRNEDKNQETKREKILKLLLTGKYSNKEIANIENVSASYVTVIKKEDIEGKKRKLSTKKRKNEELKGPDSNEPDKIELKEPAPGELGTVELKIIDYLKKGFTYQYISKILGMKQQELMGKVNELKNKKYITQKIINEAKEKRKQGNKEKVLNYLRRGYTQDEIAKEIEGMNQVNVFRIIEELKEESTITQEQIEEYKYYAEQGKAEIEKIVLDKIRQGYTVKEIIETDEEGYLTESIIRRTKTNLVMEGKISDKEIEEARNRHSKSKKQLNYKDDSDEIFKLMKKGYNITQIKKELNLSYKYIEDRKKEIKKRKNMTDKDLRELIKNARKSLKEKQTILSEEVQNTITEMKKNKTTRVINEFIDNIKMLVKLNMKVSKEDIELLCNIVLYEENFNNKENFKLVVIQYIHLGEYESAKKFMNMYVSNCEDPEQRKKFSHARDELKKVIAKEYAIKLLQKKKNIFEVMNMTGLNETEVLELKKKYIKQEKETIEHTID